MNLLQIEDRLKDYSQQQLAMEMRRPTGAVPQYMVLNELMRRQQQMQQMAQQQGQPQSTVAEDAIVAAGVPADAMRPMARALAPETDVAGNTGAMSGAPVQRMAAGGIASLAAPTVGIPEAAPAMRVPAFPASSYQLGVMPEFNYFPTPSLSITLESGDEDEDEDEDEDRPWWETVEPGEDRGGFDVWMPQSAGGGSLGGIGGLIGNAIAPLANGNFLGRGYKGVMGAGNWAGGDGDMGYDPTGGKGGGYDGGPTSMTGSEDTGGVSKMQEGGIVSLGDGASAEAVRRYLDAQERRRLGQTTGTPLPMAVVPGQVLPFEDMRQFSRQQMLGMGLPVSQAGQRMAEFRGTNVVPGAPVVPMGAPETPWFMQPGERDRPTPTPEVVGGDLLPALGAARDFIAGVNVPASMREPLPGEAERVEQMVTAGLLSEEEAAAALAPSGEGEAPAPDTPEAPAGAEPPAPLAPIAPVTAGGGGGSGGSGGAASAGGDMTSFEQEILGMLEAQAEQQEQDRWLALARTGLAMMASRNPRLAGAIGEAGLAGLEGFQGQSRQYQQDRLGMLSTLEEARLRRAQLAAAAARGAGGGERAPATLGQYASMLGDQIEALQAQRAALLPVGMEGQAPPTQLADQIGAIDAQLGQLQAERLRLLQGVGAFYGAQIGAAPPAPSGVPMGAP